MQFGEFRPAARRPAGHRTVCAPAEPCDISNRAAQRRRRGRTCSINRHNEALWKVADGQRAEVTPCRIRLDLSVSGDHCVPPFARGMILGQSKKIVIASGEAAEQSSSDEELDCFASLYSR